jgi:HEAT repeat protein
MTPLSVFVKALMKSSAISLGIAIGVVQPSFDFGPPRQATAHQSPTEGAIDGLLVALRDPDPGVRRYAAGALGRLRARRAVPALIAAIRDARPDVRFEAVNALGTIGDSRAARALASAVHDTDDCVRSQAEWALGALTD